MRTSVECAGAFGGVVLILHDSSRPPTIVVSDWKPRGLCRR